MKAAKATWSTTIKLCRETGNIYVGRDSVVAEHNKEPDKYDWDDEVLNTMGGAKGVDIEAEARNALNMS